MNLPSRSTRKAVALAACALAVLAWTTDASAQRRGRPVRGRVTTVVASPYFFGGYYGPHFHGPHFFGLGFYDPFWWGFPGYPWGWYPGAFYGGPAAPVGSARLQVTPREAEVYVDGHLTGTVDNFDGLLQRLDVPAGPHAVTFHLDGYRTVTQRILFRPGATISIRYEMEPLAAGETAGPPPAPEPPPADGDAPSPPAAPSRAAAPGPGPSTRPFAGRPRSDATAYGTLAIRIQPDDASVIVDGEAWEFSSGDGPLLLELSAGPHVVEVRRDGYVTYRRTIEVRTAETTSLNVSLSR